MRSGRFCRKINVGIGQDLWDYQNGESSDEHPYLPAPAFLVCLNQQIPGPIGMSHTLQVCQNVDDTAEKEEAKEVLQSDDLQEYPTGSHGFNML